MVQEPLFYFSVFSIKLSIAFGNQRLTRMIYSRAWETVHWTFIGIFLCLLPICTFLNMFQCLPVPAGYSLTYVGAMANPRDIRCLDRRAISLSTRILHMLSDIALLCVPIVIVARLHMPRAKKYRVSSVFAIGGMSTIASIVRNVLVLKPMDDFTWQSYVVYCFDIIDITFAAIVACFPALNSLFEAFMRRIGLTTQSGSSKISFSWMKGGSSVREQHSAPGDRLGFITLAEPDHKSEMSQLSRVDTGGVVDIQLVDIDGRSQRNW